MHRFLCTVGACVLAATVATPLAARDGSAVFPLAEVEPGLTGYGLSVFNGTEPEPFDVEVIGVWRNVQPGVSYILAKLSGQGLEHTGVVAGMSGSPVYFDDRPAGAVAFSWAFAKDAIAGITPIETMRALHTLGGTAAATSGSDAPTLDMITRGDLDEEWLNSRIARLAPPAAAQTTGSVGWVASGFGERTRTLLANALGGLTPAGSADSATAARLEPGAAVAAVLVDGDLRMAATGTVTDRAGDSLLAFGHAMFGLGALEVPMASAEVVTVVANQLNSFKVANLGTQAGAFVFDHSAGIRGVIGRTAPMIPIAVSIGGDDFSLRVADLPSITPTLVAVAMLGALDSTTAANGREGVDLEARFDLGSHGELLIEQSFDGVGCELAAAIHVLAVTGYLLQNPLAEVALEAVDLELVRHPEPHTRRLVAAHAARSVVEPGDELSLRLELLEYRGGTTRMDYPTRVPRSLPEGRYSLLVGDGVSMDAARLAIERRAPVTFPQALDYLRSLHSRRDLVMLGVIADRGLSVAGETMARLPGSVRSLWSAGAAGGAQPLELALVDRRRLRLKAPIQGAFRVDLEVRRKSPRSSTTEPTRDEGGSPP